MNSEVCHVDVSAVSLLWAVLVFLGFILSVCLHEFGHAVVAYWGGDRSVKDKGYLTFNPLKYTHPTYSIVMPLIFLLLGGLPLPGAAVYINTAALKSKGWRSAVSAAGPLATLAVTVGIAGLLQSLNPDYVVLQSELVADNFALTRVGPMNWLIQGLILLLVLEMAGVILNLIPVPGLDGFGIIEPWLPMPMQHKIRKYSRFGVLALFAAFWLVPQFNQEFWDLVYIGVESLGVPAQLSIFGFYLFRQNAQILFLVMIVGLVIANQWNKRRSPVVSSTAPAPSDLLEKKLEKINAQLAFGQDAALLVEKSSVLLQMQRYSDALVSLEQALAIDPTQSENWAITGKLHQYLDHPERAIAAYQKALEIDDQNPDYWQDLAGGYAEEKQYEASLDAYDQALVHAPDPNSYNQILLLKSRPCFYLGRYEDCLTLLDKVLQTQNDATAWYNKACCYARLGKIEQGIESLTQALSHGNDALRQDAQMDTDLDALRSHPNFSALITPN